jgi:hypothetical protein
VTILEIFIVIIEKRHDIYLLIFESSIKFEKTNEENIIILFDEQGTPTFLNRERDIFLGVAVLYKNENENIIFEHSKNEFGLDKAKPLKNDKIKIQRAQSISDILIRLNTKIIVASLNLCNTELQQVVKLYEEFGNTLRKFHRKIRGRPLSHILHQEIFDYAIYNIVNNHIDSHFSPININFSVFLDNWSIPSNDISIILEKSSEIIEQKINEINKQFFPNISVSFDNYKLLKIDCPRKRFIDVIASLISRKYLSKDDTRFFQNAQLDSMISENDITNSTIQYIRMYMDELSGKPE